MFNNIYKERKVLITGHTGFKGSWLSLWLTELGADIIGYSLEPPTKPNHFELLGLKIHSIMGDIKDRNNLIKIFKIYNPEIVFHLAAQSLVRIGYENPVETYETNIIGTVNLLEAIRLTKSVKACIIITSDKCYENREWAWPYRETDALGGSDPYSSSKACAEIITESYRRSFLQAKVAVATARAGNVIGGGDWAQDRLIPDFIRAVEENKTMKVRYPNAVRPWQHVLDPLYGYLILGEKLYIEGNLFAGAWNFGPDEVDTKSVKWIIEYLGMHFKDISWQAISSLQPREALSLKLDSSKARLYLGWKPVWHIEKALDKTIEWYRAYFEGKDMKYISITQLHEYELEVKNAKPI